MQIHASSGTTPEATVGVYTRRDIENWSDQVARVAVGGERHRREDIIQIAFGYGLFTAPWACTAAEKLGAAVISGLLRYAAKQLMMFRDFGIYRFGGHSSYALYLGKPMKEARLSYGAV